MQPRALHSTVTASISGASERTNSHRPTRRDSASRKAAAGCASSDPISRQTAASRSSTLVSGRASTLSSLIKSPFPGTQTAEELLRKNLPGARHNYLQAVARSAADHDHVVAQTHYSTLVPCLDPIHILYQHDYLSYLHCGRGSFSSYFCHSGGSLGGGNPRCSSGVIGRVSGGSSGSSASGEAAGAGAVDVFLPSGEAVTRDVFDVVIGVALLATVSGLVGFLPCLSPESGVFGSGRIELWITSLPLPLPAAFASPRSAMRSRSRWFASTAAWLTPAVLAAAAALPAMLVIAMTVPSNAIIPTLPTAPLWPPPTTMPATICGSRCAMTSRIMQTTMMIAKAPASKPVPVEATRSWRNLVPRPMINCIVIKLTPTPSTVR